MAGITQQSRNLKKLLGNPKIIFVLGGPASGKGTQCEKIIEEFGFTHISTGDLMRAEMAKGTPLGEKIKGIVAEGKLVPFEVTVELLINGLIANPSKTYLIDGFPRAIDQAEYFEQNVMEAYQILFYDVPQEIMLQRCMKRAETSGRKDDNAETIKVRVQTYFDQSMPVVEYYKQFGKVRHIDATSGIAEVYAQTKKAILPQCMFILGPKASGKSCIGESLSKRTNMSMINFSEFVEQGGYQDYGDEKVTAEFISHLAKIKCPRVALKNFPQNVFQAKFFLRNGTVPSNVFSLKCSKDVCQERMIELGEDNPSYVSSSILSKMIKEYHDSAKELLPFLNDNTNFCEVSNDQAFEKTMEQIYRHVEPTVINVRSGDKQEELCADIVKNLKEEGFLNLDVDNLRECEMKRKTNIGLEMIQHLHRDKNIPASMVVRMLNKIVYNGQESINKFILSNFPQQIDQVKEFETNCCKLAAIIYPTGQGSVVDIAQKELQNFNIESLFQKQSRLKTMNQWSSQLFQEKLGNKVEYGLACGQPNSGIDELVKLMCDNQGYKILDMQKISESVKATLGSEEEPFEGEVPVAEVEKNLEKQIQESNSSGQRVKFLFSNYVHKTEEGLIQFLDKFGMPEFILFACAEEKTVKERWCKANDNAEEVPEDALEQIKADTAAFNAKKTGLTQHYEQFGDRVNILQVNTTNCGSIESMTKDLNAKFNPRVILVNHEKSLHVDTSCSNLAIKYNMVYISAYQVIKENIENKTEWGKKLLASKSPRMVNQSLLVKDEFSEAEFSPVHFDLNIVMQLLKDTLSQKRTNQKFLILEGLCNSKKLCNVEDQLELRYMDELFAIESIIGDVAAIVGLQFDKEEEFIREDCIEYEKFPEPVVVEVKPKVEGEEGEGEEAPAEDAGEEGEKKAPQFKKEDYQWTVSNRKAKNLPQLFYGCKGINTLHEFKDANNYGITKTEQITKCLDDFCGRLQDSDNSDKYLYQQVIFEFSAAQ